MEEATMSEHDEGRRSFLKKSAAGVGVVAGAALPGEALARARRHHASEQDNGHASAPAKGRGSTENRGAFFSEDEAATVAAFAERIMPGAPGMAGATDANVVNYIDLALAGAYADQQEFYRHGLAALDAHCNATFKESFLYLKPAQQDAAIGALEEGKATGFSWPTAQAFFNTLRTHVMEGMFSDPVYGGNRDFVGWKLVGFPGAQRLYTEADMSGKAAFNRATIGLQAVAKTTNRRG
jgi:gluconate 2-dehydrogenase gamma chain